MQSILQCVDCEQTYPIDEVRYTCDDCDGLLDVVHDWSGMTITRELFDARLGSFEYPYLSGVWRYKELVYPGISNDIIVTKPEGNTNLYPLPKLADWAGVGRLSLNEPVGFSPSCFKYNR
ncbi:MAG: threonine synthase, partial [Chloroflexota bacterium]